MSGIARNFRYAIRTFRRYPGFTAVSVLTLALAIGATTSTLSLARAALVKSLPYRDPERLVHLWMTYPNGQHEFAYPDYLDWRRDNHVFVDLGGYVGGLKGSLQLREDAVSIRAAGATASFLPTLGVTPILGRGFDSRDDLPNAERVVILSHRLWKSRFGGDPGVIGHAIVFNGSSRRIAGVLPPSFNFAPAGRAEIWVNLRPDSEQMRRNLWWLKVVGRLRPGVSLRIARADLQRLESELEREYPDSHSGLGVRIVPLGEQVLGSVRAVLSALLGAVAAVLLIACANVAGLLLGRASVRRKEIAIRMALGAGTRDLVGQLLTEGLTLSLAGGTLGILASHWATRLLLAGIPEAQAAAMPYLEHAGVDGVVLASGLALTIITGVLFGLAPALPSARPTPEEAIKDTHGAGGRSSHRMRGTLVIAEIAIAIVLLSAAGLMLRSTLALLRVDPGFETKNLLTLQIQLPSSSRYDGADRLAAFHGQLLSRIRSVPGVKAAGTVDVLPLSGGGNTVYFGVEYRAVVRGGENEANIRCVSANYFHDMGIPLVAGRPFNDGDDAKSPKTLIVNRVLARRFFGNENPIGRRIRFTFNDKQPYREIVGIVGDEKQASLDIEANPVVYMSYLQSLDDSMSVVVRTAGRPEDLATPVRAAIRSLDRNVMVVGVTSMGQLISDAPSTFLRRYPAFLIGVFAGAALLLAAIGLYGIMAFAVGRRTREIGIRMALGARRGDVVRMVLSGGGRLVAAGLVIGLAGALVTTRVLSSILFRVRPSDPLTLLGVTLLLGAVALVACYLPARRAARVDPMTALRYE